MSKSIVHVVLMTHVPETRPFFIQHNQHFNFFIFPILSLSISFSLSVTCLNFFAVSILIVVRTLAVVRKHFSMSERHWKLINIVFIVAKLGNICFGRKICVPETKMFLTSNKNIFCFLAAIFFPQHMFPARLNWETFASATMFPQQCYLV